MPRFLSRYMADKAMYFDENPDPQEQSGPASYGSDWQSAFLNSPPADDSTTAYAPRSLLGMVQNLDTPSINDGTPASPAFSVYAGNTWRLPTADGSAFPSGLLPAMGLNMAGNKLSGDTSDTATDHDSTRQASPVTTDAAFFGPSFMGAPVEQVQVTGGHYVFDPSRDSFSYNDGIGIPLQFTRKDNGDKIHAYADGNEIIRADGTNNFAAADNSGLRLDAQSYDQLRQRIDHLDAKHSPIWDFFTGSGNVITPAESKELSQLQKISRAHQDENKNSELIHKYLDIDNAHFAKIKNAIERGDYITASNLFHYYDAMPYSIVAPAMHDNQHAPWPVYFAQIDEHREAAQDMLNRLEASTPRGEVSVAKLASLAPALMEATQSKDKGGISSAAKVGKTDGTIPDKPTAYSVVFEMKLDPADYGKSREVHFNRANTALDTAMQADVQFADMMEKLIPGVQYSVSAKGGRETPEGWTWEHASSSTAFNQTGIMRLVPETQHTPGSRFWRILHPDRGAAGGYAEWAIPAGAPKN